jgi:hypothetical protein
LTVSPALGLVAGLGGGLALGAGQVADQPGLEEYRLAHRARDLVQGRGERRLPLGGLGLGDGGAELARGGHADLGELREQPSVAVGHLHEQK